MGSAEQPSKLRLSDLRRAAHARHERLGGALADHGHASRRYRDLCNRNHQGREPGPLATLLRCTLAGVRAATRVAKQLCTGALQTEESPHRTIVHERRLSPNGLSVTAVRCCYTHIPKK